LGAYGERECLRFSGPARGIQELTKLRSRRHLAQPHRQADASRLSVRARWPKILGLLLDGRAAARGASRLVTRARRRRLTQAK